MMEVRVRHECQDENRSVRFGHVPPNTDPEEFIEHLRMNGGIYCLEAKQTYKQPRHRYVATAGRCYLELILSDSEFATDPPAKPRRKRKK